MTVRRAPTDLAPLRGPADLTAAWTAVTAGVPLRHRTVWLLFLDHRGRAGSVITLDDLPDGPYDVPVDDLVGLCREFIDGPGAAASVALLLTRPGAAPWTVSDRAWGRFLATAADRLGGTAWPVHWGHRRELVEFRPA